MPSSTRATAVPRAGSVPVSPLYQENVFAAVPGTCAVAVAPIRNWPACGGVAVVAVNCTFSLVPSGRLNASVIVSPLLRLVAPRSSDSVAGEPVGPVVVTLAADEVIEASFRPNGPVSSVNEIDVAVGVAC